VVCLVYSAHDSVTEQAVCTTAQNTPYMRAGCKIGLDGARGMEMKLPAMSVWGVSVSAGVSEGV
jgi:hypothetical protein